MEDHFLVPSNDPKHPLGIHAERLHCVRGLSQDFRIPESSPAAVTDAGASAAEREMTPPTLSIILAVHSHCPLPEFVERVPRPRLILSLPCCGECGLLEGERLLDYQDPDIYSPSRKVLGWHHP